MHRRTLFLIPFILLLGTSEAQAQTTVFFVDCVTGSDSFTGLSWVIGTAPIGPKKTIQGALASASAGDEIWVKECTYYPDNGPGSTVGDRTETILLKSGVSIYGGFSGGESNRSDRDWFIHPTILSGDIGQQGDKSDNSYHVVTASGTNSATILDGFTISDGNADLNTNPFDRGAGINAQGTDVRMNNIVLTSNYALQGAGIYTWGGAPVFSNVLIEGNTSNGPSAWLHDSSGSPTAVNMTITNNSSSSGVPAVKLNQNMTFNNTIIWENSGGSVFNTPGFGTATFANSIIEGSGGSGSWNGSAGIDGGGNLDADPVFVGTSFKLASGSPAIEAGDNALLPPDISDLDGDLDVSETVSRDLANGIRIRGSNVDMGAFETSLPFTCDGTLYLVADENDAFDPNLFITSLGPVGLASMAAFGTQGVKRLNAVGFNPVDGLIYGTDSSTPTLYVVDANGTITNLGTLIDSITSAPLPTGSVAGTFDLQGNYFIRLNTTLYSVDVNTLIATAVTPNPISSGIFDLAFSPFNGLLYTYFNNTIFTIDPANGAITSGILAPSGPPFLGALYFTADGRLIGFHTDTLYELNITTGAVAVIGSNLIGNTGSQDGASCSFGVDLFKTVSPQQAHAGDTVTYTYTVANATGSPITINFSDTGWGSGVFSNLIVNPPLAVGTISTLPSSTVTISSLTVPVGPSFSFSVDFQVPPSSTPGFYENQAVITNLPAGLPFVELSDDPGTTADDDPTILEVIEDPGSQICGMKFEDLDLDGLFEPNDGETGLANWLIYLSDGQGTIVSTTTDASGNYCFDGVQQGDYFVYEDHQDGWFQTHPGVNGGVYEITIVDGVDTNDIDFGNGCNDSTGVTVNTGYDHVTDQVYSPPSTNDGTTQLNTFDAFWDIVKDPDPTIPQPPGYSRPANVVAPVPNHWENWVPAQTGSSWIGGRTTIVDPLLTLLGSDDFNFDTIGLYTYRYKFCLTDTVQTLSFDFTILSDEEAEVFLVENGQRIHTFTPPVSGFTTATVISTTVSGSFLPANDYALEIDVDNQAPRGWTGLDVVGEISGPGLFFHDNICCSGTGKITGTKFRDDNGDGIWQTGTEPVMAGVQINLTNIADPSQTFQTTTDVDGNYYFDVLPGLYEVAENTLPGFLQTFPTPTTYDVAVNAGVVVSNLNFGNQEVQCQILDGSFILGAANNTVYQLDVTNMGPTAAYQITFSSPTSGVTVSPSTVSFNPPLSIGDTQTISLTIDGITPGNPADLVVALSGGFDPQTGAFDWCCKADTLHLDGMVDTAIDATRSGLPETYELLQSYPNPFNPRSTIEYRLPETGYVRLSVFDMLGREVAVLVDEARAPGVYRVVFDGDGLATGMYLYRIQVGSFVETRKMILLK